MMTRLVITLLASAALIGVSGAATAQKGGSMGAAMSGGKGGNPHTQQGTAPSASTVGAGSTSGDSATGGTAGSAAAGGTSASTLGLGGVSGDSKTLGTGGSAAAVDGRTQSRSRVHSNPNMIHGQSRAQAHERGGTWSRSQTRTRVKDDQIYSRTRTMSHVPGSKPEKSTTTTTVPVGQ
jgi:hypothetical protein